jgi:spermidine dehydrogenase
MAAKAPGLISDATAQTISAPLTGLDQSWTGPGGVGDYAIANGNTHDVVNAAHTFRNGDFDLRVRTAAETGEHYDVVVVGAGFAGCTAAYTYLKDRPNAKVLIFDNHAIFGGEARHNEFEVDGYKLWGPQGSTGAVWPPEGAKKIGMYAPIWDELGLPSEFEWQEATGTDLRSIPTRRCIFPGRQLTSAGTTTVMRWPSIPGRTGFAMYLSTTRQRTT